MSGSVFKCKDVYKFIWKLFYCWDRNNIDYIIINVIYRRFLLDKKVMKSDYYLVMDKLKLKV